MRSLNVAVPFNAPSASPPELNVPSGPLLMLIVTVLLAPVTLLPLASRISTTTVNATPAVALDGTVTMASFAGVPIGTGVGDGGTGVFVGAVVAVFVGVSVGLGVMVGVRVGVFDGVNVSDGVNVFVRVRVRVGVKVLVRVEVGVVVGVSVSTSGIRSFAQSLS